MNPWIERIAWSLFLRKRRFLVWDSGIFSLTRPKGGKKRPKGGNMRPFWTRPLGFFAFKLFFEKNAFCGSMDPSSPCTQCLNSPELIVDWPSLQTRLDSAFGDMGPWKVPRLTKVMVL